MVKSKGQLVIGQGPFTYYLCESSFQVVFNYKPVKTYLTKDRDFQFRILYDLCTPLSDITSRKQSVAFCIAANKVAQFPHNLKHS